MSTGKRPTRSLAQKIGSQGHRWVMAQIEQHAHWVARDQNEDFGIDAEAEYMPGDARGDLLKFQFKTSQSVLIRNGRVRFSVARKYLEYARSCRYPVVFVQIDLRQEKAWYLWLQEWTFENQRQVNEGGGTASTVIWVDEHCTLAAGLDGELQSIAQWRGPTQLALSLLDTMRAAMAIHNPEILREVSAILEKVAPSLPDAALTLVIEEAIRLGSRLWATHEGNSVASQLYDLVKRFGRHLSLASVDAMVMRGDSYSRTGVNALGFFYDKHFEHAHSLKLVDHFDKKEPHVAYFCALREAFPDRKSLSWIEVPREFIHRGWSFGFDDDQAFTGFHDKFANRGFSAILDYLVYHAPSASHVIPGEQTP